MRLALDATYAYSQELTGVGVYSRRLIDGLAARLPDSILYECLRAKTFWSAPTPQLPNVRRRLLQPPLPILGVDLFHALNQRIDRRPARHVVATFHDLFVLTAEYSTVAFRERFAKQARSAAKLADIVISVSAFTADQVEHLLGVPRSRIRIIGHGTDLPPLSTQVRENIVLTVGAMQKRKNTLRLIQAFERLPQDWTLVLAGPTSGYGAVEVLDYLNASSARERIQVRGYVSTRALEELYQRAAIFAFPSLDEGFGIPVLEAMAHGVPVITSSVSSLPDVAGDSALLVDPTDSDAIADALIRLTRDSDLARQLSEKGRVRAAGFSWAKAIDQTEQVYRELAG
jgi:glycosyltransferase involved in cell wall biosynthesis